MRTNKGLMYSITVLDEDRAIPLEDFCTASGLVATLVSEMVGEGILEPAGKSPGDWRFSGMCLARAQRALRLQRDLGLNWEGVAFILPLLEEVQELRRQHRGLRRLLGR